jgi:large conductance mechanosensitive channel
MFEEFKKFALRGNVMDLAIGVIIGAAFGAIVSSLVGDIIMPIIGAVTGGLDFSNYYVPLSSKVTAGLAYADAKKAGAVLGYGNFITVAINFIIIAFVLFLVIRGMNMLIARTKKEQPAAAPPPPGEDVVLLGQIRDQLSSLNTNLSRKA